MKTPLNRICTKHGLGPNSSGVCPDCQAGMPGRRYHVPRRDPFAVIIPPYTPACPTCEFIAGHAQGCPEAR
jgi:hypothetical protein